MRQQRKQRRDERGFAMLFIFALAGIAALMLYVELPKAVFESQRAKEELLVSRGQEYQRAIQLYFRKYRKYPATIEDLEKTAGIRFLRRKYVDPMTGKDEWRLIHVNGAGQFTDSKTIKPPQPAQGAGSLSSSISAETQRNDANDPALKKRASDVSAVDIGGQGSGQAGGTQMNADPASPVPPPIPPPAPGGYSFGGVGSSGSASGVGGVGQGSMGQGMAGAQGITGSTYPNSGINSQTGGMTGVPIGTSAGTSMNNGQRPLTPEQISPALGVIQQLLTQPRQPPPGVLGSATVPSGGATGLGGTPATSMSGGSTFTLSGPALNGTTAGGLGQMGAGGIAGVASKYEGRGIKLINERERIEEWEFIYDFAKDKGGKPNANMQSQQQGQGMPQTGGNPAMGGNPATGQQNPGFGQSPGFGQNPGAGQRPGNPGFGGRRNN
jgi:type II secretory pathway pseudopilin PulG